MQCASRAGGNGLIECIPCALIDTISPGSWWRTVTTPSNGARMTMFASWACAAASAASAVASWARWAAVRSDRGPFSTRR